MRISLVPQERRFYDLFRQQGALVSETLVELSKSLLEGRSRHPRLRDLEHKADDVTHELYRLTDRTFVAPMEQEDILTLAAILDDVVDLAEEAADKIDLYRVGEISDHAKRIGELAAAAGQQIERCLEQLESMDGFEERRLEIHRLENEGDRIGREALGELFADENRSAAYIIKWKEIYDLLEGVLDRCEHVANVLEGIAIKST
jgi:uncharacterized protein Yka (UPF0111/DUF47 family)